MSVKRLFVGDNALTALRSVGIGGSMEIPTPEQIEAAARAKGLSIAAMCRRADLDPSAFQRWKAGRNAPTVATVQRMLDAIEREPMGESR